MAAGRRQHPADRAVVGDRVRDRADGEERERAVLAGAEPPAQVVLGALGLLDGVQAVVAVAPAGRSWASASTSIDRPSASDQRMNSWRCSSVMWPVAVSAPIAAR